MPPKPGDRRLDDARAVLGAAAVGEDGEHLGAGLGAQSSRRPPTVPDRGAP